MECCVIDCKRMAKKTYKLREVKFAYCDTHTIIPDKIINSIKKGNNVHIDRLFNG